MSFYYPYRFVQNFEGKSGHLLSKRLYSFKSTKSNLTYWVWVELYDYNVYAIKFHLKNQDTVKESIIYYLAHLSLER